MRYFHIISSPIRNYSFLFVLVISTLSFSYASALQQEPCTDPCGKATAWQDFNSFELRVSAPEQGGYDFYRGRFDKETGDIAVDVEQAEGSSVKKGKILMIGGRIMATEGPIVERGYEIDTLDGAVLNLQLVVKALGRAFPNGPASINTAQKVDFSDAKTGIQIATASAGGMIQAPWRLVGELKRDESDGIQYDLTLTAAGANKKDKGTFRMSGKLFNGAQTRIDDQLKLDAWILYGVGVQSRKEGNATIFDYSAAPTKSTYRTVADVRKKLEAEDYPGELDNTKDFTGFWKTKCEDPFGLQIQHFGNDGKYSIVFCGPGGCGDPASQGRKTFITKDPHLEVISESEMKQQNADGWEVWHRCTKDTHPVLKYK